MVGRIFDMVLGFPPFSQQRTPRNGVWDCIYLPPLGEGLTLKVFCAINSYSTGIN